MNSKSRLLSRRVRMRRSMCVAAMSLVMAVGTGSSIAAFSSQWFLKQAVGTNVEPKPNPCIGTPSQGVSPKDTDRNRDDDPMNHPDGIAYECPKDPSGGGDGGGSGYELQPDGVYLEDPEPEPYVPGPLILAGTYNGEQPTCARGSVYDSEGPQGTNWFDSSRPEIQINFTEGGTESASDRIWMVVGANSMVEFQRAQDGSLLSSDTFVATNNQQGCIKYTPKGSNLASTYEYRSRSGRVTVFFGFDTASGYSAVYGQMWRTKIGGDSSSGAEAYISDTRGDMSMAAAMRGFIQDDLLPTARASTVFDTLDNRYTYTYTTVGGLPRMASLAVKHWNGSTWDEVVTKSYTYYEADQNEKGYIGDLKTVTTTLPQNGSVSLSKTKYYRYFTLLTGTSGTVKDHGPQRIVLDAEGFRRAAADPNHGPTWYLTATDEELKPYSSLFVVSIDSDRRVTQVILDGQCGCSGSGASGLLIHSYDDNGSYVDGSADYDSAGDWTSTQWAKRVTTQRGDGSREIKYYDYWNQLLGTVMADGDPTASGTKFLVSKVERDAQMRIKRTYAPEAIASYNHSTGAITTKTSDGLVTHYAYYEPASSSDPNYLGGNVLVQRAHSKGSTGTVYVDETYEYLTTGTNWYQDLGDGRVGKPLMTSKRQYKNEVAATDSSGLANAANFDETTYAYTFWASTGWQIKKLVTTYPVVTTAQNGPGTATTRESYLSEDGRLVFDKATDGRWTYYEYDAITQKLTRRIDDVDARSGYSAVATAASSLGATLPTANTGFHLVTEYSYDLQSRLVTTTLPTGRIQGVARSALQDGREVVLSVPRQVTTGGTTTYYGPVSYSVRTLSGKTAVSGLLTLAGTANDATAIDTWISTTSSDPIAAVNTAKACVARLSTSVLSATGSRELESRVYFSIPSSGDGTAGTNYDATLWAHDQLGRRVREKTPAGTVTRTRFDGFGRTSEQWIGTNDNDATNFPFGADSGTANMTKVAALAYDGGSGSIVGSRMVSTTKDTDGDWSGTADQRVTQYIYDYRGRVKAIVNPTSPHSVYDYDNLGRAVAVAGYSSSSGLSATSTTSTATNRLSLAQWSYDALGRQYRTTQQKIVQSSGAAGASGTELTTDIWFDSGSRVIKRAGPGGLVKYSYDRLGRERRAYTLAKSDDSTYSDSGNVTGDVVMEEEITVTNATSGDVEASVVLARRHDVGASVTGALDSNADGSDFTLTWANTLSSGSPLARAQISAMWYDEQDRMTDSVTFGSYGIDESGGPSSFSRTGMSLPTRSDTAIVTTTKYRKDGAVDWTEDPKGIKRAFVYDAAGRQTATIANYVDGSPSGTNADDDNYTRYVYTNGLLTKMWVDLDGDNVEDAGDQVTQYVYGTTKSTTIGSGSPPTSLIATGHLLREAIYPAQSSGQSAGDRTVYTAYNALSEQAWSRDQNGTEIATTFDLSGRITARAATLASGSTVDPWAKRIELSYTSRGQVTSVKQYDATSGGAVLNELAYNYNDYGFVTSLEQDPDSAIGGSGRAAYSVAWDYTKASPTGGRSSVRRTSMTLPGSSTVSYSYGTSGSIDDLLGRVKGVQVGGSSDRATYSYLGNDRLVGTELPEISVRSAVYDSSTTPVYDGLDRFGRRVKDRWNQTSSGTSVYELALAYDRNSNVTLSRDLVTEATASAGVKAFSEAYTIDNLNRLILSDRGVYSSSGGGTITGTTRRKEGWTLSQTGNWVANTLDLNGDGVFTGTDEYSETRTHSDVNEIKTRSTQTDPLTYSKAGELTDDGKSLIYVYDAFGRLVRIKSRASGNPTIAEYRYDGFGQRNGWHYDINGSNAVDSSDPWIWFVHDDRWRQVATFRGSDTNPKERFVHHNAGLDGFGGSSYIDSVILTDRDQKNGSTDTPWADAADSTCETRTYLLQNWRADTSVVMNSAGVVLQRIKYSPYGAPERLFGIQDFNKDGYIDFSDFDDFVVAFDAGAPSSDVNQDGFLDFSDFDAFQGAFEDTSIESGGREIRKLLAGYEAETTANARGMYHVRYRVYASGLGAWTRTDPSEYSSYPNLFEYVQSSPVLYIDPLGLDGFGVLTGGKSSSGLSRRTGHVFFVYNDPCAPSGKAVYTFEPGGKHGWKGPYDFAEYIAQHPDSKVYIYDIKNLDTNAVIKAILADDTAYAEHAKGGESGVNVCTSATYRAVAAGWADGQDILDYSAIPEEFRKRLEEVHGEDPGFTVTVYNPVGKPGGTPRPPAKGGYPNGKPGTVPGKGCRPVAPGGNK